MRGNCAGKGTRFGCLRGSAGAADGFNEQTALRRTQLLTALGKLVTVEPGDFVGELLDDALVAVVLLAHPVDLLPERINLRQQLRSECTQLLSGVI